MSLDPDTLLRLHQAIPALGLVHKNLTEHGTFLCAAVEKQAADALWSFPELVAAAAELHELKKRGKYHSLNVTPKDFDHA